MPKYYLKKNRSFSFSFNKKTIARLLGLGSLLGGILLFVYFFFPLLSYQVFLAPAFANSPLEVPIPKYLVAKSEGNFRSLISQGLSSLTADYTDARNWYPTLSNNSQTAKVDSYLLSVPKLKIENAEVSTKDYDLSRHLIQYFGSSIPGEKGTAIIFGHSTLPQLFDQKNYKTIFATLHSLKIGDEIFTNVNGVSYKYKIFSINITTPEDTNMFSQSYDNSYITLVTCTPPGTVWKRLVIRASLDSLDD